MKNFWVFAPKFFRHTPLHTQNISAKAYTKETKDFLRQYITYQRAPLVDFPFLKKFRNRNFLPEKNAIIPVLSGKSRFFKSHQSSIIRVGGQCYFDSFAIVVN